MFFRLFNHCGGMAELKCSLGVAFSACLLCRPIVQIERFFDFPCSVETVSSAGNHFCVLFCRCCGNVVSNQRFSAPIPIGRMFPLDIGSQMRRLLLPHLCVFSFIVLGSGEQNFQLQ